MKITKLSITPTSRAQAKEFPAAGTLPKELQ